MYKKPDNFSNYTCLSLDFPSIKTRCVTCPGTISIKKETKAIDDRNHGGIIRQDHVFIFSSALHPLFIVSTSSRCVFYGDRGGKMERDTFLMWWLIGKRFRHTLETKTRAHLIFYQLYHS